MTIRGQRLGFSAFGAVLVLYLVSSLGWAILLGHRGLLRREPEISQFTITGPKGRQTIRVVVYNPSRTAAQVKELEVKVKPSACGNPGYQLESRGEVLFSTGAQEQDPYARPSWLFARATTVEARALLEGTCSQPSTVLLLNPVAEIPSGATRELWVLLRSDFNVLRCQNIEPATGSTTTCAPVKTVAVDLPSFSSYPMDLEDDLTITASVRMLTSDGREFGRQVLLDNRARPRR